MTFGDVAFGPHHRHRPRPPPRRPTLAPHGGSSPSRTIDQTRLRLRPARLGSAATVPENPGTGGEPDGRTRRRNRPDPAGRGARQTQALPRPLASGRCGRPRRNSTGPPGPGTAARPPVLLSDNPVVCHTTKCGSGTISSPRTWTLRDQGHRYWRRRERRETPTPPAQDEPPAWSVVPCPLDFFPRT